MKKNIYRMSADPGYSNAIKNYLSVYKEKHNYDTVYLVSKDSGKYYDINGLDRVINEGKPENDWYLKILKDKQDYSVNVDKDHAAGAGNKTTLFVN